jgi:hypothetical protein
MYIYLPTSDHQMSRHNPCNRWNKCIPSLLALKQMLPPCLYEPPLSTLVLLLFLLPSNIPLHLNQLVNPLKRRHGFALLLIQRCPHHGPIAQIYFSMRLLLVRQGMLHPRIVEALGEIFSGVGAA